MGAGNNKKMDLTTTPTPSPAFLDIVWDNKVCIGQAVCEESGFAHTLIHIAALLDRLNAPYNAEITAFFANLPKEISREPQDDNLPF